VNGNTHIEAINVQGGQDIKVLVKTVSGNTITFGPNFVQPQGSSYVPTNGIGEDMLGLTAFDTTSLYLVSYNNFV
jgi:hypothetical protein